MRLRHPLSREGWVRMLLRGFLIALVVLLYSRVAVGQSPPTSSSEPGVRVNLPPQPPSDDATALAQKLQNPIADLISVPFQNNTNFNAGPHQGVQDILNIQPVVPFHLSPDWNLITRTILPLVWSQSLQPAESVPFGLAPTTFSAFLSAARPINGWVWGVGPIVQLPTISHKSLGSNVWGAGPAAVVVRVRTPWVYGVLVNNVFSLGGTSGVGGNKYSLMTINPFVNYNFGGGWFVGTVPIITANWSVGGAKWTLPVGAQIGRLIKIGNLPINLLAGAYYNALRPNYGGTWQFRAQLALVF